MFSVGFLVATILVAMFLFGTARKCSDESEGRSAAIFFGWFSLALGTIICTCVGMVGPYTNQMNSFAINQELNKTIQLHEKRRDALSDVVRRELKKYPEYEKEILENINPMMLLNFPNLKSNETMTKTVNELLNLENKVYDLREELLSVQKDIYYREISPWVIWVRSYRSFFGEDNPIANN